MNKLELANGVLEKCRLDAITGFDDSILRQFPYNNLLPFIEEAIYLFSNFKVWSWGFVSTDLTFVEDLISYDLKDYEIDPQLVNLVYTPGPSDDNPNVIQLVSNNDFESYSSNPSEQARPSVCTKYGSELKFYPALDKDYGIIVDNYAHITPLLGQSDEITIIPKQFQMAIEDYICSCMSAVLFKKATSNFDDSYERGLARMSQVSQVNHNQTQLPSNIDWSII